MVCDTNRRNRKSSSHHAPHFNDSIPDDDQLSSLTNEITVCLRHISHKTKISWAIWVKTTLKRQSLLSDLRRPPIVVAYGRFEEKQSKHSFMNKLLVVPAFRSKWFSYSNSLFTGRFTTASEGDILLCFLVGRKLFSYQICYKINKMRSTNPKTL